MNHTLKVVGLGPGGMNYLTLEALESLEAAEVVYLRTEKHPVIDKLRERGIKFESYDSFYEKFESFDEVYLSVAKDVVAKTEIGPVVYAVPGNPFVAEKKQLSIFKKWRWNRALKLNLSMVLVL